jgi:hypothetical protein
MQQQQQHQQQQPKATEMIADVVDCNLRVAAL